MECMFEKNVRSNYLSSKNRMYTVLISFNMDTKQGHMTCGNRLAIEREGSFQKFASFEEEFHLFCLGLLGSSKTSSCCLTLEKMTPAH